MFKKNSKILLPLLRIAVTVTNFRRAISRSRSTRFLLLGKEPK